jgi:O-antigen/teichoic acid export membrane protein
MQVAGTSGARVYVTLMMLMITAATARFLGPDGRGVLVAASGWVTTFATFGYLSMAQPLFFRVRGREPAEWLPESVGTLMALVAVLTVLGWAVAAACFALSDGAVFRGIGPVALLFAFGALPFLLWQENGTAILLAMGELRVLNIIQVITATASLLLVVLLVGGVGFGVPGALVAVGAAPALTALLGIGFLFRRARSLRVDWKVARELVVGGIQLHAGSVGMVLATQAGILIVNQYRPPQETAFLNLAGQLLTGLLILPGAISSVAYAAIGRHGPDGAWPEHRRLLGQTLALVTAMAAAAYLLAPLAVTLVAGREFLPAVPLFRLLLPTAIASAFATVLVSQWVARGWFAAMGVYGLVLGVANVVGSLLLVPRYGVVGAVWVGLGCAAFNLAVNVGGALWVQRLWRRSLVHAS